MRPMGSGQTVVVGGWWTLLEAGLPAQTCPAAAPSPVDVVEVEPSLLKELTERAVADPAQFPDQTSPVDPKRRADIAEHQLGRHRVQFDMAAGGKRGEAMFQLSFQAATTATGQRAVAEIEPEVGMLVDGEQDIHLPVAQCSKGGSSSFLVGPRGDRPGGDAGLVEPASHELGVLDATQNRALGSFGDR